MDTDTPRGPIVIVSPDGEHPLADRLEASGQSAQSVSAGADLEAVLTAASPVGIVVCLDEPAAVRECLESVRAVTVTAATVVAPASGSEPVAAAAVSADATEYIPLDEDGAVEGILEAIDTDPVGAQTASMYHRILARELPDEAFVIDADGTYLEVNVRPDVPALRTATADELVGKTLEDVFPDDDASRFRACIDRALESEEIQTIEYETELTTGIRQFEARVVPTDERIAGRRAVVWLARDVTERVAREHELKARQADLETLNRINAVGRQVIETLVETPGRDAIERDVCIQLVDSKLYSGAWIAELGPDDELIYRTGAGEADSVLEYVRRSDLDRSHPTVEAATTGEIQTVNGVTETELFGRSLQAAARADGVRALIAVPVIHEDVIYGVLTVLSSRGDAFSETERAEFELLGETMGFTMMAVKNRQLLFSDAVVELEFRIDGGDTFTFKLTEQYDCRCLLEWSGQTAAGRTNQIVTVEGVDGETVLEEAREDDTVEECRLISDGDNRCTIELRLGKSGVRTLSNHGATIRRVTVEDSIGTCLVEVPQDADIREIADALASTYERTELVARRVVDRPVRTATQRRDRIVDELTDRQLTTLRLAYYSGFFDWPRESTGEEIADAMDVSPPTMHQHLRKGLNTILEEFFGERH